MRLYLRINFIPGADPEIIKDMFEHSFINLIYVSNNYKELEMLPKEIKEVTTQKDNKGKTRNFCQIPRYLP